MKRVVVIGSGITGLAAAWRILKSSSVPINLLVLDSSAEAGGSLKTTAREGFLLESGADCFISEKPQAIELCRELGLETELIGTRPDKRRSFILHHDQFFPVPEGFYLMGPTRKRPFLESRLLSWPGKFRALCEPLMPRRESVDESLASFVRRRFGAELLDRMAQPMIGGIYGASAEKLSLRATFPQFLDMERTYGSVLLGLKMGREARDRETASGARYSLFVSLRGGMQSLARALLQKLGQAVVRLQTPVKAVRPEGEMWQIVKASGEVLTADTLCIALPSFATAELVKSFDPDLADDLAAIENGPAATVNIALREMDVKRPLDGVGFVIPAKENKLILGCTFAHNKFEGRAPKGFLLLRAILGGQSSDRWLTLNNEHLTSQVLQELRPWLGIVGPPIFTHLECSDRALPQYAVGHLERVLRIEERLFRHKGLALAGNWQHGVGIPDCIASAERAAQQLGFERA